MKRKSSHIIVALLMLVAVLPSLASDLIGESRKQKADYVFHEAVKQRMLGNNDAYYELLKHSYALDSTNTLVGFNLGSAMIYCNDSWTETGLKMMRKHFETCPDDYENGLMFVKMMDYVDSTYTDLETFVKRFPKETELKYVLAERYLQSKSIGKLDTLISDIEKQSGYTYDLMGLCVSRNVADGDTVAAINAGRRFYDLAPNNTANIIALANVFDLFGYADSSALYIKKAEELSPNSPNVLYYKLNYYSMRNDTTNLQKYVVKFVENEDVPLEPKLSVTTQFARLLYKKDEPNEQVKAMFEKLTTVHPLDAEPHSAYADYLRAVGQYGSAYVEERYAMDLDPTNNDYAMVCAFLAMNLGQTNDLQEIAGKVYANDSTNIAPYLFLASSYQQSRHYDESLEVYDKLAAMCDTANAEHMMHIYLGKADLYSNQDMADSAKVYYEKAVAISPDNAMVLNNYAYLLSRLGSELDKAESMSLKAMRIEPDNDTYIDTYAWILFKKGEYKTALIYIEKIASDETKELADEEYEHYGDILFMNGQPDKAVEQWQKAVDAGGDSELLKKKLKNRTYYYK